MFKEWGLAGIKGRLHSCRGNTATVGGKAGKRRLESSLLEEAGRREEWQPEQGIWFPLLTALSRETAVSLSLNFALRSTVPSHWLDSVSLPSVISVVTRTLSIGHSICLQVSVPCISINTGHIILSIMSPVCFEGKNSNIQCIPFVPFFAWDLEGNSCFSQNENNSTFVPVD